MADETRTRRTTSTASVYGVASFRLPLLVCFIADAYRHGDWQPVIDELRELFDAAVESVAEENLPAEFRKADAS